MFFKNWIRTLVVSLSLIFLVGSATAFPPLPLDDTAFDKCPLWVYYHAGGKEYDLYITACEDNQHSRFVAVSIESSMPFWPLGEMGDWEDEFFLATLLFTGEGSFYGIFFETEEEIEEAVVGQHYVLYSPQIQIEIWEELFEDEAIWFDDEEEFEKRWRDVLEKKALEYSKEPGEVREYFSDLLLQFLGMLDEFVRVNSPPDELVGLIGQLKRMSNVWMPVVVRFKKSTTWGKIKSL